MGTIVRTRPPPPPPPPPPPFFLKESEKLKKGGGSMVLGQVFLRGGGLVLFLFNFLKVYHFYI